LDSTLTRQKAVTEVRPAWVAWALLALAAITLVPVWIPPVLPLQDLPNHLLKVDILIRFLSGDAEASRIYALNLKPFSNYACYVLMGAVAPIFGLMTAAKIFVSGYVLGLPLAMYAWLRQANPRSVLLALAVPALTFNLYLSKGNLNFCAGLALYAVALAVFASSQERTRLALFGSIATVLYFTHGFVFLALVGAVGIVVVMTPERVRAVRALGLAPGLIAFAALTFADARTPAGSRAMRPVFEAPGAYLAADGFRWLFTPYGWGHDSYAAIAWLAAIAVCGICTAHSLTTDLRNGMGVRALLRTHVWLIVAAALALAYAFAPVQLTDWGHLRARLIPLVTLTALVGLRIPSDRRWQYAIGAVFVIAGILIPFRHAGEYVRGSQRVEQYLQAMSAFEAGSSLLPIDQDEREGDVRLNLHSWAYFHIDRGGWSPYLHAYPSYHPIVFRSKPWAPSEDLRGEPVSDALVRHAAECYDFVLLWAPVDAAAGPFEPFFERVFQSADVQLWRNRAGVAKRPPGSMPGCVDEAGSGAGHA
jgi:hypothetical protein